MKGNFGQVKGCTAWISLFFTEWHSFNVCIGARPMMIFGRQKCLVTKF